MSPSAVIAPGLTTLSGVLRIALFDEDEVEVDVRASVVKWPGDRVETVALLMPGSSKAVPPSTIEAFAAPPASEPWVTPSAALAALLAVLVLTAGGAAVTWVVALLLFR